jgi:hypothetical protein
LCTEATGLTKNGVMLRPKHYNPDAGEIDSMNVSVAAILIFEAKDNEDFKLPILGYRIKKKKKTQNYEKQIIYSDNSNHDISFFRQITEPQVDALVNKTLTAFNVPGIAVAIIKDGKVVLAKGYGVNP